MLRRLPVLIGMVLAAVLVVPAATAQAKQAARKYPPRGVNIIRIQYDPPGQDSRRLNREYIVVKNDNRYPVRIGGWTIGDRHHQRYRFHRYAVLGPHRALVLHTGWGRNGHGHYYWKKRWPVWDNRRDAAFLRDRRGQLVDFCAYAGMKQGYITC